MEEAQAPTSRDFDLRANQNNSFHHVVFPAQSASGISIFYYTSRDTAFQLYT